MNGGHLLKMLVWVVMISLIAPSTGYIHGKNIDTSINMEGKKVLNYNIQSLFDRDVLGDDYPYDMNTIKNMTLSDLNWTEQDIDGDGNSTWFINYTGPDGKNYSVRVIEGTFGGKDMLGGDNYTMISKYDLENGTIKPKTIHLRHAAVLFIPEKPYNLTNCTGYGYGIFVNTHDVPNPSDTYYQAIIKLFMYEFNTPILLAGEYDQNWKSFNYSSQDEILFPSALASFFALEDGYNVTQALKMFYIYPLVRMNLLAHTLFQRLVEYYGGNLSKGILSEGASKQGYARWLISMLDDRVKVAECDYMQIEDLLNSTRRYYTDWGLPPIENSSAGDWANYSNQIESLMIPIGEAMFSGMANESSPYHIFYDVWDIGHQIRYIKSDFVSITGGLGVGTYDNGEYKPSHDGVYFPLGSETPFLERLKNVEWRYGRDFMGIDSLSSVPISEVRSVNNLFAAAEWLLTHNSSAWPKVANVSVDISPINSTAEYLNVTAVINYTGKNLTAYLWYAPSSDRRWNDPEQTKEPFKWKNVTLNTTDNRTFKGSVMINTSWMYGYYVEARAPGIKIPGYWQLYRFDASPVKFINPYPYVVNGSCDFYVKNMTASNINPGVGEKVWINATVEVSRVKIWFKGPYVTPPMENINVRMLVDGNLYAEKNITINREENVSFIWYPDSDGVHHIEIEVNQNKLVYEYNYTNNSATMPVTVGTVPEFNSYFILIFIATISIVEIRRIQRRRSGKE